MKSLSSRRVEGLPIEVGAGRLELILIRERSLRTPQSRTDITTFSKGEKFRTALNPSSKFDIGCGLSSGHVLYPLLLALYTDLATDVVKLGMCRARI